MLSEIQVGLAMKRGELLREERERAGLTQEELAKKVGVDNSYISKMENEVASPTRDVAVKLADALGLRKKSRRRLAFLLAAKVASEEDMKGFALVEDGDGQAAVGQPTQKASPSTLLHSPLPTSDQEILMHRLEVLKKKVEEAEEMFEAAAKKLREVREDQRELAAFTEEMFNQE